MTSESISYTSTLVYMVLVHGMAADTKTSVNIACCAVDIIFPLYKANHNFRFSPELFRFSCTELFILLYFIIGFIRHFYNRYYTREC